MSAICASGTCAPGGRIDQYPLQRAEISSIVAQVADVHRVALPAFHGGGDRLAADGRHQYFVGVVDPQAVARELIALQIEVKEVSAGGALRKDAAWCQGCP